MAREALISGKSKTFPPNYLRSLRVSLISGNITAEFPDQSSMEKAVNFQKEERILDAPDFVDDFYLNLFDWGSRNILSIALGSIVYLWNGSDGSISELVSVGKEIRPITSVSWAPDGRHIAVGLNGIPFQSHEPGWVHCHICSKG